MNDQSNHLVPTYDLRQSEEFTRYSEAYGFSAHYVGPLPVFIHTWPIVGSVAKIQRPIGPIPWDELDTLLRRHRTFISRIEPFWWTKDLNEKDLIHHGYILDHEPLRPTKTLRIDISGTEPTILKSFHRARSWIGKIDPSSYTKTVNNFDLFYDIWRQATARQHIWISTRDNYDHLLRCFGKNVFTITLNDTCGCLILVYKKTAYYFYAAALPIAKEHALPYAVVWEAMKEAKARGCEIWDFESIYDDRWPKMYTSWKGFSQFKKTFGGTEITFPGCYTKKSLRAIFGY